jgi:ADP-ribose pyrophosphatase YjhB (NUDIX family)
MPESFISSRAEILPPEHLLSLQNVARAQASIAPVKEYRDIPPGEYFDVPALDTFAALPERLEWPDVPGVSKRAFHATYWADPPAFRMQGGERVWDTEAVAAINARTEAAIAKYGVRLTEKDPESGLWLNPLLFAGTDVPLIGGRGVLGKYGLNETVDLRIVARDPHGAFHVLSFKRPLNEDVLAMPGGYIDYGESAKEAVLREFGEEIKGTKIPAEAWQTMRRVGSFIVADPRATRLAFNGTTVFEIEVPWSFAETAQFADTPEAKDTRFRQVGKGGVTADLHERFLGSHREMMSVDMEKR